MPSCLRPLFLACLMALPAIPDAAAQDTLHGLPLLFEEDFSDGMERWAPTDPNAWTIGHEDGDAVLVLYQQSEYEPPVRSPFNIALLEELWVSDFILEVKVKSTRREYGHRDLCFIYGWQDPAHFYYTHIASIPDPHAGSIFIVDGEPRVSIATERPDSTTWRNGEYHTVRIARDVEAGTIEVYFDDLETPIMRATDDTFRYGRIGLGSFDDTGVFDDVRIWGRRTEKP